MALLLGCVADDVTGATDLANTLVRNGMRTVQLFGVPAPDEPLPDADAIVIALKSRTAPVQQAVDESLAALRRLRADGARQLFFKYCSTFDSTPQGNIGPVADAMLKELGANFTIACPAFPENARTVCHGYLFVGDALLSESGMRNHPLTPMNDANLVRVLGQQTHGGVGLVRFDTVDAGPVALREAFEAHAAEGQTYAIVDALTDGHLKTIGEACAGMALITGGSGIAIGLPENFRRAGLLEQRDDAEALPKVAGHEAVLAGSCSEATLAQVAHMAARRPAIFIDPMRLDEDAEAVADEAARSAVSRLDEGPVLVYSSAAPDQVTQAQERFGAEVIGERIERALARVAGAGVLVEAGVRRLVVAGGETSGAVVQELGVRGIRIGPQIDPGVPWTVTTSEPQIALALKSGNFGSEDFFLKAFEVLP
ncbi:MAG: four-carbon acid sugar kinase family protein [Chloroflexi bacterium]|nr:four-carbon acid sugar kinase family protein [Chloroflexota bacterium]